LPVFYLSDIEENEIKREVTKMSNETFRMVRMYLKLTQQEFAEYLGIAYSTVCGIEAGNRRVTDTVHSKVARKFEVTPDFIEFAERVKRLESI
jgi:DNA-binding XRE family transcriptional regulator